MGMFDYFAGNLRCPSCGTVSASDSTTNMQTKIREKPQMVELRVGDPVPLSAPSVAADDVFGYRRIQAPANEEPIRLLDRWECPTCGAGNNWAEVVIHNGVITSIEAVPFDRAHFEHSHLVSEDAIDIVQGRTDQPYAELFKQDLVKLLRETL